MSAYEVAKAGGKHSGMLRNLGTQGETQMRHGVKKLRESAALHDEKAASPQRFVPDWDAHDQRYRNGLLAKWRDEAQNAREQAQIIEAYIDEHGR